MMRGGKTCWRAIQVQGPGSGRDELRELDRTERLAALYRFQNGEVSADHSFVHLVEGHRGAQVTDPADVDWDTFPLLAALEAVTRDELRRLRDVLRADPANATATRPPPPASPTSSGTWAIDFGKRVTSSQA